MLLAVILVALTAAGWGLFALRPAWLPMAITADARSWDQQFGTTLVVCAVIFTLAQLGLAWVVIRRKRDAAPTKDASWPEFAWTIATAILFLGLAVGGARGWTGFQSHARNLEEIEVYAHQFAWSFRYPGPDGRFGKTSLDLISDSGGNPLGLDPKDARGADDIVSATLRVPVGRRVRLLLHSRDVIHDFFVRELRTKQDVVPGMEIPLEIQVDRPGSYELACAELCGLGHSQMRSMLIALPAVEYEAWKVRR